MFLREKTSHQVGGRCECRYSNFDGILGHSTAYPLPIVIFPPAWSHQRFPSVSTVRYIVGIPDYVQNNIPYI